VRAVSVLEFFGEIRRPVRDWWSLRPLTKPEPPKVKNAAVRFSAVQAIDHLTQKEPAPVADALQKIVDENKAKDDRNMMQADAPVKQILYRLRAR
jgi:hypothetical protein